MFIFGLGVELQPSQTRNEGAISVFGALNTNDDGRGRLEKGCGLVLQYKYVRMQGAGLCKLINFKRGHLAPCRESQRASMSVLTLLVLS